MEPRHPQETTSDEDPDKNGKISDLYIIYYTSATSDTSENHRFSHLRGTFFIDFGNVARTPSRNPDGNNIFVIFADFLSPWAPKRCPTDSKMPPKSTSKQAAAPGGTPEAATGTPNPQNDTKNKGKPVPKREISGAAVPP